MKIVLVIPTYNERENVVRLVPLLDTEFKKFPQHEFKVVFVDGNSPDGTGKIVTDLSKTYPYVVLLPEKSKNGLGAAYFYGFDYAMKTLSADAVVEMDADLQHSPKDLSKMIEVFDTGYDYVIGSRYIKGGSIPKEWAFYRKLLSFGGSLFSKIVLGIFSVNDFTTGFKISRVKGFVDRLDFTKINSKGFAYKIELLYRMHLLGAKIKEVPITFGLRDRGDSKMEKDNTLDSMRVVIKLRLTQHKNFVKFVIVGFGGLFTDLSSFTLFKFVTTASVASALSGLVGMITTFTLNNFWSFKERKITNFSKLILTFVPYFLSSYVPIIFRSWLIHFVTSIFGENFVFEYAAFFVGIFFGLVWNYFIYSKLIWRVKKTKMERL